MKAPLLIIIILAISLSSLGQMRIDAKDDIDGVKNMKAITDSLSLKVIQVPDTLLPVFQKMDSIRLDFNLAADSISNQYQNTVSKIDAESKKLNQKLDSLHRLDSPTETLTPKLDSLHGVRRELESKFTSELNALKSKTTDKLNALDLPPEYGKPLQELSRSVNELNINSDVIKIPELKVPGYTLPEIQLPTDLTGKAADFGQIDGIGKVPDVKSPVDNLGGISEQVSAYKGDVKNIASGNLEDVQTLPEAIEQQASKIDGIDELQKQSGVIDQHNAQLQDLNDPDKAKKKAVEVAKKAATDHFAGKQEQLKAAMEKISKYKQKYSSVSSIKDLPKRPPNPMKSKPFVERLVPGVYLQYQQKNFYLLDVNPYVGYKLSGRFRTGLGWNHRYAYDKDNRSFNTRARIYGPRAYVDFKLGKGFIAHVEGESMNAFVPSTLRGNPDTGHREWVWGMMTGLKKEYKIYKNLKGTALIQYNVFNRYYKAPYVDRLNSRWGLSGW